MTADDDLRTHILAEISALRREVADVNQRLARMEGGGKALWGAFAFVGILGGIISQFIQYVFPR